jgi:hypothetical protein
MKTTILLFALFVGIALTVLAKGGSSGSGSVSAVSSGSVSAVGSGSVSAVGSTSVSAVGSHAANNGGFSQPPITVSAGEATAHSTTDDSTTAGGTATGGSTTMAGTTPPPNADDASFPGYPPQDTNAAPTNAESWSDIIVVTNSNGSVTNLYPHTNADGDMTNANGTMTYDTGKPHWWVKQY